MALRPSECCRRGASQKTRINASLLWSLSTISGLRDSDNRDFTKEAREVLLHSHRGVLLHQPNNLLPRIQSASQSQGAPSGPTSRVGGIAAPRSPRGSTRPQGGAAGPSQRIQSHDSLISRATGGLRKFPIQRSWQEKQAIQKMLRGFACLTNHMSVEELPCIADIGIVESWERGHTVFARYGFYVILKGAVRPVDPDWGATEGEPDGPALLGVGDSFGSLRPTGEEGEDSGRCVVTTEPTDTLKVSHSGYAELQREVRAKSFAQKEQLISGCCSHGRWPALSVHSLACLLTTRRFPPGHVLLQEGEIPPFVGFIAEGECDVWRSTRGLRTGTSPAGQWGRTRTTSKGVRVQTLLLGRLGARRSLGMESVLRGQPSPCSVVTATEARVGVVEADAMRALDPGTISLILQSTKDTYGDLTQEELGKEYVRQQKAKQWNSFKIKILREALFNKEPS